MIRNKSAGMGEILNNGEPVQCALRLANLLNEQTALLKTMLGISSDLNET